MPSGRWQARIFNSDGERVSLGSYPTKTDAQQALRPAVGDQIRGDWIAPRAGRLTFHEYATEWLETRQAIRRRTRELYESLLRNHIVPTFGDVAVGSITTRHVRQ